MLEGGGVGGGISLMGMAAIAARGSGGVFLYWGPGAQGGGKPQKHRLKTYTHHFLRKYM